MNRPSSSSSYQMNTYTHYSECSRGFTVFTRHKRLPTLFCKHFRYICRIGRRMSPHSLLHLDSTKPPSSASVRIFFRFPKISSIVVCFGPANLRNQILTYVPPLCDIYTNHPREPQPLWPISHNMKNAHVHRQLYCGRACI